MTDDQKQLATVATSQRRYDQSLVAGSSHRANEAFLLQPMERAANGRSTEAHPRDDRPLGDAGARRQLARDDQLAELMINARNVVDRFVRSRAPCGRRRAAGGRLRL